MVLTQCSKCGAWLYVDGPCEICEWEAVVMPTPWSKKK